jgi:ApaG protein
MFSKSTHNIAVSVMPVYLDDQSDPSEDHFVWAYTINIENHSGQPVQLLNRHWEVMDCNGQVQHVKGAGVVGEQPIIKSGEGFQYTSGTVLSTPSGYMVGEYQMQHTATKELFSVGIPAFSLDSPHQITRPN